MNVEASYGWEKNEGKENAYCNYDSSGSNSCYFGAEACVVGRIGVRSGGMNGFSETDSSKISG